MPCTPFLSIFWVILSSTSVPFGLALDIRSSFSPIDLRRRMTLHSSLGSSHTSSLGSSHEAQVQSELAARDLFISQQWRSFRTLTPPWKAKNQSNNRDRNICVGGKQLPDFYVLGVQKCATSSLANNLMLAGMRNVHGDKNPKEFHWFDHRMDHTLTGNEGWLANQHEWLSWMPKCPVVKRHALADFTPDYLRIVPRPGEFEFASPRDWMKVQVLDLTGPQKMINMYGESRAPKLNFAVMFREPLSQMQSAWYHAASFNFTNACKSCRAESFKDALRANLEGLEQSPPQLTPWQWTTMYARQLEPWLQHFSASQFYIIPMKQLTSDKKDNICQDLSNRLDFEVDCDSQGTSSLHSWSHAHPSVDEDSGSDMRQKFDQFMQEENNHLVRLLATGHLQGMGLANYQGEGGNEEQIGKWLFESW